MLAWMEQDHDSVPYTATPLPPSTIVLGKLRGRGRKLRPGSGLRCSAAHSSITWTDEESSSTLSHIRTRPLPTNPAPFLWRKISLYNTFDQPSAFNSYRRPTPRPSQYLTDNLSFLLDTLEKNHTSPLPRTSYSHHWPPTPPTSSLEEIHETNNPPPPITHFVPCPPHFPLYSR